MKRFGLIAALAFAAALVPAAAWALSPSEAEVARVVDDAVVRSTQGGSCKGLAIVARHGDARVTHFSGDAGNGTPPKGDTLFAIGSITKTLTATLLVWSVHQGTMHLDDPLQSYAPPGVNVPTFGGQKMLLSQLADHTSGLPRRVRGIGDPLQPAQAWAWLNTQRQLPRAPGSEYQYSTPGYGYLGLAIERANHASLQDLYDRVISRPLGMRDTTFVLSPEQKARLAAGYSQDSQVVTWKREWFPAFNGSGALYSTVQDMALYLDFELHRKTAPVSPLLPELLRPRHSAKRQDMIGLGWDIKTVGNITFYLKHGSQPGYASMMVFAPAAQAGAVVLSNQGRCPTPRIALAIVHGLSGGGRGDVTEDDSDDSD